MMIRTTAKKAAPVRDLTTNEAFAITKRIRTAVDRVWSLLLEAHDRKAWKALKYPSWEAYIKAEFQIGRAHAYRLLDQGRVISAIEEATGNLSPSGDISEAAAREIKGDLPSVTAEIKARVEQGEKPNKAATDVIAETRAAKVKVKAENERQRDEHRAALPDAIKQRDQARTDAITKRKIDASDSEMQARVEELEEANRVLEDENASFRAQIAKFGPMRVQFEHGGFEKILADKDEVIRTLETRLYSESADKASWMKSAKYWQEQAKNLGFSSDVVIDIETGEVVGG